jgi:small nuclear ribonucleoprotein (snRNP)-like protein
MIIQLIIEILLTGGAASAERAGAALLKSFREIFEGFFKLAGKAAIKSAKLLDTILDLLKTFKDQSKKLKPFLDEILKFIRVLLGAIPKQLTEFFNKFDIVIKKVPQAKPLFTGIPVKLEENLYALFKKGKEIFRGTKKEVEELSEKLKKLSDKDAKKYLDEIIKLKNSFKFKGFLHSFDDHLLRGEIKIIIKNAQTGLKKEIYKYATGKGGKNANEILPPWQIKVDNAAGVHMHKYIDGKTIRKLSTLETKTLNTGEKVEIVEIQFYIKKLGGFLKKKESTLWPKNWTLDKIKKITKEASENVIFNNNRKYVGVSKEGYQVEFFSETNGIIDNAYLNFNKF